MSELLYEYESSGKCDTCNGDYNNTTGLKKEKKDKDTILSKLKDCSCANDGCNGKIKYDKVKEYIVEVIKKDEKEENKIKDIISL